MNTRLMCLLFGLFCFCCALYYSIYDEINHVTFYVVMSFYWKYEADRKEK